MQPMNEGSVGAMSVKLNGGGGGLSARDRAKRIHFHLKMLLQGKLILTRNGFMLDEVKSLLQKGLRRCDADLVGMAAKELHGKDQIKWKALTTMLFEDHCLADAQTLRDFYLC